MSGNDEKTRWKFLWKQINDWYLQKPLAPSIHNPQTDPMDVLLWYLRFSMISIKALWIKNNEEEEETSKMLGSGLKHTTTCGCKKCRKL